MLKKITLFVFLLLSFTESFAALVPVVSGAATSANSRAPQGSQRYIRTAYIITAAEMAASGLPVNAIVNAIGWSYSVAQSVPTTGNFKIYLENTTDLAYSKPTTTWTNSTNGVIDNMTLVSDGPGTIPSIIGNFDLVFANGLPFTYTGGGLYVAFEYSNPSGTISIANTALCNNAAVGGVDGLKNAFSTLSMPAAVTGTSLFRPVTRLGYPLPNDGMVHDIYSLGKLPLGLATPHIVSARIVNSGDNPLLNLPVTLSITGANTFSDIQTITLPIGGSTIVNFASFTPVNTGSDTLIVTIPSDDILTNNADTFTQDVNNSILAYSNSSPATSSVGFNTGTGILASKYSVNGSTGVLSINAFIYNTANNAGNTLTGIVLDNAGTIIGTSAPHVVTVAELGTWVSFPITVPPVVASQDFYVGILQAANLASGYFPIGVQPEPLPARPNAYYSFGVAGGAATNYVNLGRVMIEAVMSIFPLATDDLKLTASAVGGDVQLHWTTSHQMVDRFEIERSADGKQFEVLGNFASQAGVDNKGFHFVDMNAMNANVSAWHYRIRQIELNGNISYSALATVKLLNDEKFAVSVINPVQERVTMKVGVPEAGTITISLTDVHGRIIYSKSRQMGAGANNLALEDCDRLPPGSYLLVVSDGKSTISRKLTQQ